MKQSAAVEKLHSAPSRFLGEGLDVDVLIHAADLFSCPDLKLLKNLSSHQDCDDTLSVPEQGQLHPLLQAVA